MMQVIGNELINANVLIHFEKVKGTPRHPIKAEVRIPKGSTLAYVLDIFDFDKTDELLIRKNHQPVKLSDEVEDADIIAVMVSEAKKKGQ